MTANSIMIQGTSSNAGKSAVVTGLCRLLQRKGISVAPFKPQNMSLNSAVTADGGEIGRAQALQAQACGVLPVTDMNPVLLKPTSNLGAQVIVQGRSIGNFDAAAFHALKPKLLPAVLESYDRLRSQFEVIVVEGAGSPAEINLREGDLANMGFARAAGCPVALVADIERGGVFAQLLGTVDLLEKKDRQLVQGFIINKFRGDARLLESGIKELENRTGIRTFGIIKYINSLYLAGEDSLSSCEQKSSSDRTLLQTSVLCTPRMSNRTDFDPLIFQEDIHVKFVREGERIAPCDLIILAGSKAVHSDLDFIRNQQWDKDIFRHLRYGGKLLGICGGFQMLGDTLYDEHGIESNTTESKGLGLLRMETRTYPQKKLLKRKGRLKFDGSYIEGYEIHQGQTTGNALSNPFAILDGIPEGVLSQDNQIAGTYLHGLFDHPDSLKAILKWAGHWPSEVFDVRKAQEENIDRLADCLDTCCDIKQMLEQCGIMVQNSNHLNLGVAAIT